MTDQELVAHARSLLEVNRYLTLATADPDGRPWVTPVYFVASEPWEFTWVSAVDARHSRNIAGRPQVGLVVFDSTVEPYHGRAVYAAARAGELAGDDLDRGIETYARAGGRGAAPVTRDDVTGTSRYRLYRATPSELWVLCPREPRQSCPRHGLAEDHRARVA